MSLDSVQTIIGRAVQEPGYRDLLFNKPDAALQGYDLTNEESYALKKMQREKFDKVAGELEGRISRVGLGVLFEEGDPGLRSILSGLFE